MAFSPPGFGGDAPDGSPDFTGASVLGLVAAGGVYTLLNPLICTTLTVRTGFTLKTDGIPLWREPL